MTDIDTKQYVDGTALFYAAQGEIDSLRNALKVRDENYATLLKRWKEATQDLAIFRAENQRLKDLTGD